MSAPDRYIPVRETGHKGFVPHSIRRQSRVVSWLWQRRWAGRVGLNYNNGRRLARWLP